MKKWKEKTAVERINTATMRHVADEFWAAHDSESYGGITGRTREVGSGVNNITRLDGTIGSYNFGALPRFFWSWWDTARERVHLARCLVRAREHVSYRRKLRGVSRWLSNVHALINAREELRTGVGKAAALWRRRSLGAFVLGWRDITKQRVVVRRRIIGHIRQSLLAKATRRWQRHTESRRRQGAVASTLACIVDEIRDGVMITMARAHYRRKCFRLQQKIS